MDPELRLFLEGFTTLQLTREGLAELRATLNAAILSAAPPCPDGVTREARLIRGPAGAPDVRVLIHAPASPSASRPAYLHIHGGGYMLGLPEMNQARCAAMALALGAVVVSVDYRLAPEHPHPAGLEDCYATLVWLWREAASLGVDPGKIAIGGESAGGGLAANLALLVRDRGETRIVSQALIYPMLDDRTGGAVPPSPGVVEDVWPAASNVLGWTCLLGHEPGAADPPAYAAASRAQDLAGLAPAFIAVGGLDLLRDEDLAYAGRLMIQGVATELHVYPGAFHAFDLASEAAVSRRMIRDLHGALARAFAGDRPDAGQ
jgi:acetyl esterase/lipase